MGGSTAPARRIAATRRSALPGAASAPLTRTRSAAALCGCAISPIRAHSKSGSTICCCTTTRCCAASMKPKSTAPSCWTRCTPWRRRSCPTPTNAGGCSARRGGRALTKSDVLDGSKKIKICPAYRHGRKRYDSLPAGTATKAELEPVYETAEGWRESTRGARSWADLPATAIKYIRRLEELIGAPVAMLSTSPERDDTVLVRDPFAD